jgi:pimeloyl-ACP methyl ester carboxylesterase
LVVENAVPRRAMINVWCLTNKAAVNADHFDTLARLAGQINTRRGLGRLLLGLVSTSGVLLDSNETAARPQDGKPKRANSTGKTEDLGPKNDKRGNTKDSRQKHRQHKACRSCRKRHKGRCTKRRRDGISCGTCQVCQDGDCIRILEGNECGGQAPPAYCYETLPNEYLRTDVAALIGFNEPSGAEAKRQEIVDFLWKGNGLPTSEAVDVKVDVPNPITTLSISNLASVDELAVEVGERMSYVYHFRPSNQNDRLMLYHAGHSEQLFMAGGDHTIRHLIEQGFDVLGFYMPGFGPNSPLPPAPNRHDAFAHQETMRFTPLVYFLEPVVVVLNYITAQHIFSDIGMIGISGGGWTTTLCAAIDPRIRRSYPVAGSLPLYLRTPPCSSELEPGDWEQSRSGLYATVDYTALYVLGAYGQDRQQVQVLIQYDSCCFWGVRYRAYEPQVQRVVHDLGSGSFSVLLDSTTRGQHGITLWTLQQLFPNSG